RSNVVRCTSRLRIRPRCLGAGAQEAVRRKGSAAAARPATPWEGAAETGRAGWSRSAGPARGAPGGAPGSRRAARPPDQLLAAGTRPGELLSTFSPFTLAFAQLLKMASKSALLETLLRFIIIPPMSPASRPSTARPTTAPV